MEMSDTTAIPAETNPFEEKKKIIRLKAKYDSLQHKFRANKATFVSDPGTYLHARGPFLTSPLAPGVKFVP
jgi:hypothetical protein